MDLNTFTGFEESISSMGTWFEERTSSMGTWVPKNGRFSTLEGGRSDCGGRWKGRQQWEAIATDEEKVRGEASAKKSSRMKWPQKGKIKNKKEGKEKKKW